MPLRHFWTLLSFVAFSSQVLAQAKNEKPTAPNQPDPHTVEVRFADDSIVKMVLQQSNIEVTTRYGKLMVPVEEIRRIDFGLRIPDETAKRIETAVSRLGSADFKQRSAASSDLLSLRELAYPAVQRAARSNDLEVARRAEELLKTLTEKVPADKLHLPRHDTVVALDFTIVGQVETGVIKARTPYFGEASLKIAELRGMRWLGADREAKVSIDAAKYGGQQELWLDTGAELRIGTTLQISASGNVDLRPMPGNPPVALTGPDGMPIRTARAGAGIGGAFPGGAAGGPAGRRAATTDAAGALIARIGEHGRAFFVGSRFEGPAPDEGKLYLRIVPSPYGDSSGSYDVRVNTGR